MQFTYNLFLVLHFIGISGLLGGLLAQIAVMPKQLPKFVLHSAWLAFLAAVVMVGINQKMNSDDATVEVLDHIKVAVKSTILIIVLAIGYLNIKKTAISNRAWGLMTLLTISNIVIAVFW
jgi:Na+/glutamate symporter